MTEGITPEQFKVLSALRKEAKETIKAEYIDVLENNRFTVLKVLYLEPVQQYHIIFKLNGEEYSIQIEKLDQITALHMGVPQKAIEFIYNIIADKLAKIFLGETC